MTLQSPPTGHTLGDALHAYEREYLPRKAPTTQYQERLLYRWLSAELGDIALADLSPLVLRTWRDSLRPFLKPNSIRRYMTSLSAVLTVAVEEYEWLATHPLRKVAKPPAAPDRERSLSAAQQARLLAACQASRNRQLYVAVVVALSTATRKNELLQRQWCEVDLARGLLSIPQAKNGERRAIPLVPHAVEILRQHATQGTSCWVFPRADGQKPVFLDYAWRQACARAGLEDWHFHDLRHTSASYLAMSGASLREIAEILGHKSLKQT